MENMQKQNDMKTQLGKLVVAGHLHLKKANATRNKSVFKEAPDGINAAVARMLVDVSEETTEKTIINWSAKSNGLTVGQASALCISAVRYAIKLTDCDSNDAFTKAHLIHFKGLVADEVEAYIANLATEADDAISDDDLSDDDLSDDDLIGEIDDDDLTDDDEPTPTATVEADFIPYDTLKACLATTEARNAVVQGAMSVFFSDDNANSEGRFQYRVDGKARTKSLNDLTPSSKSKKTQTQLFMDKIASMCGMNMAGIATKRGGKWASDHVFKGGSETATPDRNTNRLIRNRLGVLWCAIVVKSGSTDCTLDMRKFVSDDTIGRVCSAFVCPQADLSDATYTKNNQQVQYRDGWLHNYARGNGSGSGSFDDLMADNTTFL